MSVVRVSAGCAEAWHEGTILSVDDWIKERLDVVQLSQYLIWTDKKRDMPRYGGYPVEPSLGRHLRGGELELVIGRV